MKKVAVVVGVLVIFILGLCWYFTKANYSQNKELGWVGPIVQMGFYVKDREKAMKLFSDLFGVGPWITGEDKNKLIYKGKEIPVHVKGAFAFWGHINIELVQHAGPDSYNWHRESLAGPERDINLHHIKFRVPNLEQAVKYMQSKGIEPMILRAQPHKAGPVVIKTAFFDTRDTLGVVVEMSETRMFGVDVGQPAWLFKLGKIVMRGKIRDENSPPAR